MAHQRSPEGANLRTAFREFFRIALRTSGNDARRRLMYRTPLAHCVFNRPCHRGVGGIDKLKLDPRREALAKASCLKAA